jgi:DNA-binding response OmpR family regulator
MKGDIMKILIVDDEPLVRKSLARAFRAKGHDVTEAVDGAEGLGFWSRARFELVLLDVLMPGLSGPELLREMIGSGRSREEIGRVILMSAFSGEHNMTTAQHMGADLFVPKPFDDVFAFVQTAESLV